MQLRDIGQLGQLLANSPVFFDEVWDRDVEDTTGFHLTLFRARMSAQGLGFQANEAVDMLQDQAIRAMALGTLQDAPFIGHVQAEPRFIVDELLEGLNKLSLPRRQATLLALDQGMAAQAVIQLTWERVLEMIPTTQLAIDILRERNRKRHHRLSYVFWEHVSVTVSAPLFHLEESVIKAFGGRQWPELRIGYQTMVMINQKIEGVLATHALRKLT